MKKCSQCEELKTEEDFANDYGKDPIGKKAHCKGCAYEMIKRSIAKNPEHYKKYKRTYDDGNREKNNEYRTDYAKRTKENPCEKAAFFTKQRKKYKVGQREISKRTGVDITIISGFENGRKVISEGRKDQLLKALSEIIS
jgi:DNA-binding transcriptional regulator YiaG